MISVASYHQERLWFVHEFEREKLYVEDPIYFNLALTCIIDGALDTTRLYGAANELVLHYDIFNTSIVSVDGAPCQRINAERQPLAWHSAAFQSREQALIAAQELRDIPFRLDSLRLVRIFLGSVTATETVFSIIAHNSICDRESLRLFFKNLMQCYSMPQNEESAAHRHRQEITYAEFAAWQKSFSPEVVEELLFYWKRKLQHWETLYFPTDYPRAPVHIFREGNLQACVAPSLGKRLNDFLASKNVPANTFFFSIFNFLLFRFTYQPAIVCGYYHHYRHEETENVLGPVANFLVFNTSIDPDESFLDFIFRVTESYGERVQQGHLPFDKLADSMLLEKDMSRCALFDVLFNYENENLPTVPGLSFSPQETNGGLGKYDINLLVRQSGGNYSVHIAYNTTLFEERSVRQFVDCFMAAIEAVLNDPSARFSKISLVKQAIDVPAKRVSPRDTFLSKFIHFAGCTPEAVALTFGDRSVSYGQLERLSNQMAHALERVYGNLTGRLLAVIMDPSDTLIATLLAIHKCGAAYVPVNPAYPASRVNYILSESNCTAVLVTLEHRSIIDGNVPCKAVDLPEEFCLRPDDADRPINRAAPGEPAYVIYTSGTTGKPKGCVVTHDNLFSLLDNSTRLFSFTTSDAWLLAHSFAFDFSVWEIFGALAHGARLVIPLRAQVLNTEWLHKIVAAERITVLNITPGAFYAFKEVALAKDNPDLPHLRLVIFGGERLEYANMKDWVRQFPLAKVKMVNMYGITETTVHVTYHFITPGDVYGVRRDSVIGRVLPDVTLYIFDAWMNPVPAGVYGEFYVGGTGVSRGYLNNPALTAERFFAHPHHAGEVIYKTGDVGKWLHDGAAVFKGRNDKQIKVRGFRIERTEIESAILKTQQVEEAVVVLKKIGGHDELLVAYVVAKTYVHADTLRAMLVKDLPAYMIPDHFIQLQRLPLTINGKINETALPAPHSAHELQPEAGPLSSAQKTIAAIWQKYTGTLQVSIHDNFFQVGGNSLKVVKVWGDLNRHYPGKLDLQDLFENVTIAELSRRIETVVATPDTPVDLFTKQFATPVTEQKGSVDLYFIPPSSGLSYCYQPLIEKLGDTFNPTLFNFNGIVDSAPVFHSMEAVIESYAHHIMANTTDRPVVIAGYSSGGNFAFEIARYLERNDIRPLTLIIDSRLREHREQHEIDLGKKGGLREDLLRLYHEILQDMEISLKDYPKRAAFIDNYKEVVWAFYKLFRNYTVTEGAVESPAIVFALEENREFVRHWQRHFKGEFHLVQLPAGPHGELLNIEENIQVIAEVVTKHVKQLEQVKEDLNA